MFGFFVQLICCPQLPMNQLEKKNQTLPNFRIPNTSGQDSGEGEKQHLSTQKV